jgi:hypothetical protein
MDWQKHLDEVAHYERMIASLQEQLAAAEATIGAMREKLSKVVVKSQLNDGVLPFDIEQELAVLLEATHTTADEIEKGAQP